MPRNALMVRFKVFVDDTFLPDVISFAGLDLGGEGTIDVPEWDRVSLIADGKRKVTEINMKYRLMETMITHNFMLNWWNNRAALNRKVECRWFKRDWTPLFNWVYYDCELAQFKGDDQELGTPKLGIIECKMYPYEVELVTP